jgi:hypothetical protein
VSLTRKPCGFAGTRASFAQSPHAGWATEVFHSLWDRILLSAEKGRLPMHPFGVSDATWAEWGNAFIASNVIAGALFVLTWKAPAVARSLFALMFIAAGIVNTRTALTNPAAYLDYAQWATVPYHDFIEGPFAANPARFVLPIAAGQLLCGVMLGLGGRPVARLGAFGATVFLLAIVPLGFGAAFPATLVMAVGTMLIWETMPELTVFQRLRAWVRRSERSRSVEVENQG